MVTISPTSTTCCIIKDGWNYHYFHHDASEKLICHRESERIIMNEKYHKIIGQHITITNVKNKKIRMDNTKFPSFDEQKALQIVEEAIDKNQAHIEVFIYLIPV